MTSARDPRRSTRVKRVALEIVGDLALAAIILVPAFALLPYRDLRPTSAFAALVVIAPALALPLRRRFPIPVLAACLALYGSAALLGTLPPGAIIATAVAAFSAANRSPRRTTLIAGSVAVVAVVAFGALGATVTTADVLDPQVLQSGFAVAFAAAAGDATRSRREYVSALAERAERAEQTREAEARRRVSEERLRIARDLHDAVAHQIAVISLNAGVATASLDDAGRSPQRAQEALGTIRGAARTVLSEIGDLLKMLRADEAADAPTAPQPGLERLDELIRLFREVGLDVTLRIDGDLSTVGDAARHVGYRVVQEALTNAHKHGAGGRAHVLVDVGGREARILVTNPVAPPHSAGRSSDRRDGWTGGYGLVGLRERVAAVRGIVETGAAASTYRLEARLPLAAERVS